MIAIVSVTWAGKTTTANLIEGFYEPETGQILLDGVDLRQWSKHELRSHIDFVTQRVSIFSEKFNLAA